MDVVQPGVGDAHVLAQAQGGHVGQAVVHHLVVEADVEHRRDHPLAVDDGAVLGLGGDRGRGCPVEACALDEITLDHAVSPVFCPWSQRATVAAFNASETSATK